MDRLGYYKRLGLMDPAVFRVMTRYAQRDLAEVRSGERRMGRTTSTIVAALEDIAAFNRPVLLVAANHDMAKHMGKQAQRWASQLQLDASLIEFTSSRTHGGRPDIGWDRERVFYDHWLGE